MEIVSDRGTSLGTFLFRSKKAIHEPGIWPLPLLIKLLSTKLKILKMIKILDNDFTA